ncbi:MAG: GNAT family N-acetyltransferase [Coriobacteriales bacterium]
MTLKIRVATPHDAQAIQAIYAPYVEQTAITFEYEAPTVEEIRRRIESTLQRYPWIVAEEEGEVVGYAYAGAFKGRRAYDWSVETSIYVKRDARQKGTGRQLYTALQELLKQMGITNVNACVAYTEKDTPRLTTASVRFHEKLGFKKVGVFHQCAYKFDTWYDMCWLEKHIAPHEDGAHPEVRWFPQLKL